MYVPIMSPTIYFATTSKRVQVAPSSGQTQHMASTCTWIFSSKKLWVLSDNDWRKRYWNGNCFDKHCTHENQWHSYVGRRGQACPPQLLVKSRKNGNFPVQSGQNRLLFFWGGELFLCPGNCLAPSPTPYPHPWWEKAGYATASLRQFVFGHQKTRVVIQWEH